MVQRLTGSLIDIQIQEKTFKQFSDWDLNRSLGVLIEEKASFTNYVLTRDQLSYCGELSV